MSETITLDEIHERGIELPKDTLTFPVNEFEEHRIQMQGIGGIYTFTHQTEGYLYVGISKQVESRLIAHINGTKKANKALVDKLKEIQGTLVTIFIEPNNSLREFYENYLILKYDPKCNKAKKSKITDGFPTPTHEFSKQTQHEIITLYQNNVSLPQIEKITGVNRYSQRNILKRNKAQRTHGTHEQRETRNKRILELREEGWVREVIAEELGVSASTIAGVVHKDRVKKGVSKPRKSSSYYKKRKEEVLKLAKEGVSIKDICDNFNMTDSHVSAILTNNGLKKREELTKILEKRNIEIMRLYSEEGWTQSEIGKEFNLRQGSVGNIISRLTKDNENKFDKRKSINRKKK